MTIGTSAATLSRLDEWWRRRGYAGDPFIASKAEDASLKQLQDWHIDCPWPANLPRTGIDTLAAVIAEGDSRLVLIYAPPGGGKTFYRRLAAQLCREAVNSRGALEISVTDLNRAGLSGQDGITAWRLAVCVRERILAHHPQLASVTGAISFGGADDSGSVLSQCAALATSFNSERGGAKLYIFLDDLDKIYYGLRRRKRSAAMQAIADFLGDIAGGAAGETLAVRVFLPRDLRELIQQALAPNLRKLILLVELLWSAESCMEVAERRLHIAWHSTEPRVGHLAHFLSEEAVDMVRDELRKQQRQKHLSPRDVINKLSSVANCAARQGLEDQRVSGEIYRLSRESARIRPWPWLFRTLWPWLLAVSGFAFLLWRYAQIRTDLMALLSLLSRAVRLMIALPASGVRFILEWLIGVQDLAEAFLLLVAVLGAGIFLSWCLRESYRSGERLNWRRCLQQAWQFVRRYLPGSS